MKFFVGLLLAVAISSTVGLPARNPDDDAEFVNVNSGPDRSSSSAAGESPDFTGVVDTGIVYPGGRGSYPFSSFGGDSGVFDGISDFMRRFRENIFNRWWQNIPTFDVAELDPSKGNTTSVIKVVDGHRVEINDTVYTKTDDGGNAFYKVRVVNVRPLDSEEDGTATTAPDSGEEPKKESPEVPKKPSPEVPSRESSDNEINKSTEVKDLTSSYNTNRY